MRLTGGRTAKRAVVATALELRSTGAADAPLRLGDLVRRAGRRARQQRVGQVALPAAARRRRQRPRPRARAGGRHPAHSGRAHRAGSCSARGCDRAGSRRPTTTPPCTGARCWRSCTAATTTAPGCRATSPPARSTATGWRGPREQTFDSLSGGQQARLQILLLELSGATLLLLDEPTDNLDLHSAEALEDALDAFEGTVLAVTHDRWFARGFDRFLVFRADGKVVQSRRAGLGRGPGEPAALRPWRWRWHRIGAGACRARGAGRHWRHGPTAQQGSHPRRRGGPQPG